MHLYEFEDPREEVEHSYVLQKFDKSELTGECRWWSCVGHSHKDYIANKYLEALKSIPVYPYRVIKVTKEVKRNWEVLDLDYENSNT